MKMRRIVFFLIVFSVAATAQQALTFKRTVELAMQNSASVAIADADQQRARSAYLEQRNLFLPQMVVGSGAAVTAGYPLSIEGSAPSVLSLTTQQFLFNSAQRQFVSSAKKEMEVSATQREQRRRQAGLDAAIAFVQFARLGEALQILQAQETSSKKLEEIVTARVREGVDSLTDLSRARLNAARARLQAAEVQTAVDVLRQRLSALTGLSADAITVDAASIPAMPAAPSDAINQAVATSPEIQIARQRAEAKHLRAEGERRASYPQVDIAGQYGYFTRYNNYDKVFNSFQNNNASFGVVIRFPFLDFSQRARAEAAKAEALGASREADLTKSQVAGNTIQLEGAVRQAAVAREIAELEYQISEADTAGAQARMESGQGSLRDVETARIAQGIAQVRLLDAMASLEKAQLQLLEATGQLPALLK